MKINYQETTSDLATRINIHNQFGGKDIDRWMLDLLSLKPGMKILDVGCGTGKQCSLFYNHLNGQVEITGGDVSEDMINKARAEAIKNGYQINFTQVDLNKHFDFEDNSFDLLSCCFTIYYSLNIPYTIQEMHRILKPRGRLFTTGPMPDNKQMFYDIIREATGKPIPPMPGSSRFSSEILSTIKDQFSVVEVNIFNNPLTFNTVEPFIAYTRASLSEDRKLWSSLFQDKDDFERIMRQITTVAEKWLARDGKLVMVKVVGGFTATK
jgi:ubiquinone/menaquinone biosynthesis C-methylase UbiE